MNGNKKIAKKIVAGSMAVMPDLPEHMNITVMLCRYRQQSKKTKTLRN